MNITIEGCESPVFSSGVGLTVATSNTSIGACAREGHFAATD
jgi:hypothetical protein